MTTLAQTFITSQVIAEHSPALLRLALRMTRLRADAEDVVQETWFSALCSTATFEGRSSLRSWLTTILRRRIADRRRRQRVMLPLREDEPDERVAPSHTQVHDLRQAVGLVGDAISDLPGLERRAILLCDVTGMERDDAATNLAITRGHLRVLLHRARGKVEGHLTDRGFGADLLD